MVQFFKQENETGEGILPTWLPSIYIQPGDDVNMEKHQKISMVIGSDKSCDEREYAVIETLPECLVVLFAIFETIEW